jgi:hypothetical protein
VDSTSQGDVWSPRGGIGGPASASTPRHIAQWRTQRIGPSLDRLGAGRVPAPAGRTKDPTMGSRQADGLDLEQQVWAATETIREAVLQLLQAGDVHPNVIVLALARVTGETGTAAALVGGEIVEKVLGELAEVVRRTGRDHQEMLQGEGLPVTGNA